MDEQQEPFSPLRLYSKDALQKKDGYNQFYISCSGKEVQRSVPTTLTMIQANLLPLLNRLVYRNIC